MPFSDLSTWGEPELILISVTHNCGRYIGKFQNDDYHARYAVIVRNLLDVMCR
jgi:hypothetical protein